MTSNKDRRPLNGNLHHLRGLQAWQPGNQRRKHRAQRSHYADNYNERDDTFIDLLNFDLRRQNALDVEQGEAKGRSQEAGLQQRIKMHINCKQNYDLQSSNRSTGNTYSLQLINEAQAAVGRSAGG